MVRQPLPFDVMAIEQSLCVKSVKERKTYTHTVTRTIHFHQFLKYRRYLLTLSTSLCIHIPFSVQFSSFTFTVSASLDFIHFCSLPKGIQCSAALSQNSRVRLPIDFSYLLVLRPKCEESRTAIQVTTIWPHFSRVFYITYFRGFTREKKGLELEQPNK